MLRSLVLTLVAAAVLTGPLLAQAAGPPDHPDREIPPTPFRRPRPDAAPEVDPRQHVIGARWFAHASPDDSRYRRAHPFAHGRFTVLGPTSPYTVQRVNRGTHRLWLTGGFGFEVADWEWPQTIAWCWTCGTRFVVYEDPDHFGWYLLLNTRSNEYVHALYRGG